ncbi:MAG: hypothetical protein ACK55Z_32460, partial [bacterium]
MCRAIKINGTICGRTLTGENQTNRCKLHDNVVQMKGPHTVARFELLYVQRKQIRDFDANYHERWRVIQGEERRILTEEYRIQRA